MDSSLSIDGEAQTPASVPKLGGWVTFPFVIATMAGLTLAQGGWTQNLIVYLIQEFNVKSIDAAQIFNVVNGCTTLFPVLGAIIADAYLGCFSIIWISAAISVLGTILLTLTAGLGSLRPPPCSSGSSLCISPSKSQLAFLYTGLALSALGMGGTRFTIGTMGANQFKKPKHQAIFFNWYFFTMYASVVLSVTAIVYVEDSVSWAWGYGLCVLFNVLGLGIFLTGSRFYLHVEPQGSPFLDLIRVVVAAIRKRKALISPESEDYYYQKPVDIVVKIAADSPSRTFTFLNRAALKTEGDIKSDGSIAKPWRICTVQQVEDLKTIIRISPLWSTGIFLSTPLGIQASMIVLQALKMNRHLGPHFQIPAGSVIVFVLLSTCISLTFIDRLIFPLWHRLTRRPLTPLQRVGVGHFFNVFGMILSALVESKRLKSNQNGSMLSLFWLWPPLAISGLGEAFHFPGQVALYYQEFPVSLKSTTTAMVATFIGIAFYLSTALIDLIRRVTGWLPDDINHGRVDNVYWVMAVIGTLNFGYFLVVAWFYRYQNVPNDVNDNTSSSAS